MQLLPASPEALESVLHVLKKGGIVAHATETCYGLACDLSNPEAVKKLFAIKQRPLDQPVSALFSSIDEAKKYVEWNDEAQKLADEFLPGPLTIVLTMRSSTPRKLFCFPPLPRTREGPGLPAVALAKAGEGVTLGIRLSPHPLASTLVKKFGSPLSTTSANLHGRPNPYSIEDIVRQFSGQEFQPDLLLDSGALPLTPPSTIIDLTGSDKALVRKGSLDLH